MRRGRNRNRLRKKEIPCNAHYDHANDIDAENENDVSPARHCPRDEACPKTLELLPSLTADLAMPRHETTSGFGPSGRAMPLRRKAKSRGSLRRRTLSTSRALHRSKAMSPARLASRVSAPSPVVDSRMTPARSISSIAPGRSILATTLLIGT